MNGRRLGLRDYKRPRRAGLDIDAAQLRGFALGLMLGLAVAAVVYISDHRAHAVTAEQLRPVPQQRAPDDLGLPPIHAASDGDGARAAAPDVAATPGTVAAPGSVAADSVVPDSATADSAAADRAAAGRAAGGGQPPPTIGRFDFYQMLPRAQVLVSPHEHVSHVAPAAPVQQPGTYLLQIGSYRDGAVAERVRSQAARLGITATVQRITVGSDVWHRVRVGPLHDLSELNRLRKQLQDAGLGSLVVRVED